MSTPTPEAAAELCARRITNYLGNGGLFNPELMEHGKVRDLLLDCRAAIESLQRQRDEARAHHESWAVEHQKEIDAAHRLRIAAEAKAAAMRKLLHRIAATDAHGFYVTPMSGELRAAIDAALKASD